jgi:hypothetical protein
VTMFGHITKRGHRTSPLKEIVGNSERTPGYSNSVAIRL